MASWLPGILEKINSEIGWDDRYAVPELDDENLALIKEIQEQERLLEGVEMSLQKSNDQKQIQAKQEESLDRELVNIDAVIKVKDREIETLSNLTVLTERQRDGVLKRTASMMREINSLTQKEKTLKDCIFKTKQGLEELRERMNWDQETMDEFLKESALQNEEKIAIIKYSQKDDRKIKSLTLAIDKMTVEVKDKRNELDKEIIETKSAQIALDKTTENMQKIYEVTKELAKQWENTLKQVKQRDDEIHQCGLLIAAANQNYREKTAILTQSKQLLDTQRYNNKELKQKIDLSNREGLRLRQNLKEEESNCRRLHDEANTCKGALDKTTSNVKYLRSNISKMKKDIQENNIKLKDAEDHSAALEHKLQVVTQTALSEEERAAQMEYFLKKEEQMIKELNIQLDEHNTKLLLAKHHLETARKNKQFLIIQISKSNLMVKNLKRDLLKQEKNLRTQWSILTSQSKEVIMLKKKLEQLQGKLPSQETEELKLEISELSKTLEEKRKTANALTNAIKESENAVRCLRREVERSEAQKSDLSNTVDELRLVCSTSEKELKRLTLKKQDSIVEQQILKAEVKRLSDLLNNKEDNMLSSEKRKLELQKALKDRECAIGLQREALSRLLHVSDQERHKLSIHLSEKVRKVDIMRKRYELIAQAMSVPECEGENAEAYIITKTALELEELRRKRDSLAAELQKAGNENVALENSNVLFKHHNSSLRQCLNKVDTSSPDYVQKLRLEEQLKANQQTLKYQKKQIRELQQDLQDKNNTYEHLLQEEKAEQEKIDFQQQVISKLNKDISSHQEKIDRAIKQSSKLIKQIRTAKKTESQTFEEKDIKLRELKEVKKNFYKMLNETMENNPALRPVLEKYFHQAQLPIPSPSPNTSSRRSSTQNSSCSVASLRSGASTAGSSSSRDSESRGSHLNVMDLAFVVPPTSPSSKGTSSASGGSSRSSSRSRRSHKL